MFGILKYFLKHLDVLNTSIYSLNEGLLCAAVYLPVLGHVLGHPVRLDLVKWRADAGRQGNKAEV